MVLKLPWLTVCRKIKGIITYNSTYPMMDRLSLLDRVAVITGSSSGIGEATARLFSKRGAKITIHGRSEEKLEEVKLMLLQNGSTSEEVHTVTGDITDPAVREKMVEETVQKFGCIDILVNNAGGGGQAGFLRDVTEDQMDFAFNVYLKAPVLLSKLCLPYLVKRKGNIINVSGITATEVWPGAFPYNSFAKAGLDNFTKFAAAEFGQAGVRVNCVRPGVVVTPSFNAAFPDSSVREQFLSSCAKRTLLDFNGAPEDVAEIIAFYASDAAKFLTGDFTCADGGRSINCNHGETMPQPNYDDFLT
ncbi:aklaviketone reductase DauE isoform X1 [Aplysia californica]|uniref:Aklaviketone reductase DauE isoform X1 n=2 Tax=Aplysia californica TaxID=6500 RepID=A0ABM0ZVN3_APLCA|nr:aklaviketone reductase DauE isoform X1 [Aplysia californica]